MKAALLELLAGEPHGVQARNTAREYLQARILLALQDHGAFTDWAFLGGTALRFRYRLPRYSEDLDFSLVTPGGDGRFEALMRAAQHDLTAEAYMVEVTVRTRSAVAVGRLKSADCCMRQGSRPTPTRCWQSESMSIPIRRPVRRPKPSSSAGSACSICCTMTGHRCSRASSMRCSRAAIRKGGTSLTSLGIWPIPPGRPRTSLCSTTRCGRRGGKDRRQRRQRGVNSSSTNSTPSIGRPHGRT